jgi:phosphate starvation-inducible PhoH-like protein
LNERIIELIDIAPKEFWALKILILIQLRNIPKLKIVARGTTLKAFEKKKS